MEKETRIIEINGIKLEVDLRNAKRVDSFRIGDNVRLLVKSYGDEYKVHPGVIVGFDEFEKLPTIIIAYLSISYNEADIKFAYINNGEEVKDAKYEVAPAYDLQELHFQKSDVLSLMDRKITEKENELKDLELKKEYFNKYFSKYFEKETQLNK